MFRITWVGNNPNSNYALPINELNIELDGNHLAFKIILNDKMDFFLGLVAQLIGWKPQTSTPFIILTFSSDINRDLVLLGVSEYFQKLEAKDKQNGTLNGGHDKS